MNLMMITNSLEGWFLIVDSTILMLSLLGNCLALYGVSKAHFRLVGYRRFLISLVVGDLFLTLVHLFDKANQIFIAESMSQCCRCATFLVRSLLLVGVFVNLFNLCGMSVDHYIGIIMRKRLARCTLLFIWLGALCCGFADTPILAVTYYFDHSGPSFKFSSSKSPVAHRFIVHPDLYLPPGGNLSQFLNHHAYLPADIAGYRLQQQRQNTTRHLRMPVLTAEFGPPANVMSNNYFKLYQKVEMADIMTTSEMMATKVKKTRSEINSIRNRSLAYYREQQTDWCLYFGSRKKWLELVSGLCVVVSFAFISAFYGKTFNRASTALNTRSIRKLTVTTCLLLGVFAICWLPFALVELVMGLSTLRSLAQAHNESLLIIHKVFYTVFLLNRILDPIVYVARLPNVQRFLLRQFGFCLPCLKITLPRTGSEERASERGAQFNNNIDRIASPHGSIKYQQTCTKKSDGKTDDDHQEKIIIVNDVVVVANEVKDDPDVAQIMRLTVMMSDD